MARYLLSTHSIEGEARQPMTDDEMKQFMTRIGALEEEMRSVGAWVFSGRLHDPDTATVVPFAEAKEHLGGFYIVEAEDLDAALAWGAKTSECIMRPIEVRPFMHT